MADAAYMILTSDAMTVTGIFFVDDEVLAAHSVVDLSRYNPPGVADIDITPDLFVASLRELAWKRE
jgi:citronellol/citronellal dehydrogenase